MLGDYTVLETENDRERELEMKVSLSLSFKGIILHCLNGDSSWTLFLYNNGSFLNFKSVAHINMIEGKTSLLNELMLLILWPFQSYKDVIP